MTLLCKIAQVDRSNFYKWKSTYNPTKFSTLDKALTQVFEDSDRTYGYRRMHLALKSLGFNCNEKIIRKRMAFLNLKCEIRQKKLKYKHTNSNLKLTNHLAQNFHTSMPNEKYSVDITFLPTKNGMVYLNVIVDLFGNIPVAYLSSYKCDSKLAEDTIDLLVANKHNISNAIMHSDQGATYVSNSYIKKLVDLKVIPSHSKKGCPFDNACSENFFSIFKTEKFHRLGYCPENKEEIDEIVENYIDFYINKRISLSLGGLTPKQYYDNYIKNTKRLTN